ncbi:alpha/beta hydrolase-fold protein [Nonomuraea insulae]|uniref:Alpha/beta hydrolase-fold protein n=1 Tax=Nonomuraea insulae TaxID=1616787 RepID=A0ABW1CC95_9ACTN
MRRPRVWLTGSAVVLVAVAFVVFRSQPTGPFMAAPATTSPSVVRVLDGQKAGDRGEQLSVHPAALWGDVRTNKDVWDAHNPTKLAGQLRGVRLYVSSGNGQAGPLDPPGATGDFEDALLSQSKAFARQARAAGVKITTDFYGPGRHTWPYWERALKRAMPVLRAAVGV